MDVFAQMLHELGIFNHGIPPDDVIVEPVIAVESSYDSSYEWWDWAPEVVQASNDIDAPFALDYEQEQEFNRNCTKRHHYSRKGRFKFTLNQLIGVSGHIPKHLIDLVKFKLGKKTRRSRIWNNIRKILKAHGLRKYYNRIPQFISTICHINPQGNMNAAIPAILLDFHCFDYQFDFELKKGWKREYFPNLRFVALKLLEKHGITFPYTIPIVRTVRKRKYLEDLYMDFKCVGVIEDEKTKRDQDFAKREKVSETYFKQEDLWTCEFTQV